MKLYLLTLLRCVICHFIGGGGSHIVRRRHMTRRTRLRQRRGGVVRLRGRRLRTSLHFGDGRLSDIMVVGVTRRRFLGSLGRRVRGRGLSKRRDHGGLSGLLTLIGGGVISSRRD